MATSFEELPAQEAGAGGAWTREAWTVAAIAVVSLIVRAISAGATDLFQDEALYWWQAHGRLTFSPHPPGVQVAVRLGAALLGRGTLGLRAASLLGCTGGTVLSYLLAREIYGARAGVWAAGLFASCPLFFVTGVVATADSLLVFLWLLLIYACWRGAHSGGIAWWAVTGIALAAGFYTKYMMVLAVPSGLLALCASKDGRAALGRRGPWMAVILGAALFAPVFLAWNSRYDWGALRYHLGARHEWVWDADLFGYYFLGHAGVISPALFLAVIVAMVAAWRSWRRGDERGAWVLSFTLVPVLFFFAPSVFTKRLMVREHWDAIGYAAGIVAVAGLVAPRDASSRGQGWRRGLGVGALGVALLCTVALLVLSGWPSLAVRLGVRAPTDHMLGWRELAGRVRELEASWAGAPPFLVADSFRPALCVGFHLNRHTHIYTLRHERNIRYGLDDQLRERGMDVRDMREAHAGEDAIYLHEYRADSSGVEHEPTSVYRFFHKVEPIEDFRVVHGGREVKHFGIFRARDCRRQPLKPRSQ